MDRTPTPRQQRTETSTKVTATTDGNPLTIIRSKSPGGRRYQEHYHGDAFREGTMRMEGKKITREQNRGQK